jgi:hypothetical protein
MHISKLQLAKHEIDWCALTERLAIERTHTTGCEWCGGLEDEHGSECAWEIWQSMMRLEQRFPARPMS